MMNKFIKNLSALFLALTVFTVNIPMESVNALEVIKMTTGESSSDTSSDTSSDSSSNTSSDTSSGDNDPVKPVLSFTVDAYSTEASWTVFDDEDITITVKNAKEEENFLYIYEWLLDGALYSEPGNSVTFKSGDLNSGSALSIRATYKAYEGAPAEETYTHEEDLKTITVVPRPSISPDILPTENKYAVGTTSNINDLYLEIPSEFDYNDFEIEWVTTSGLTGTNAAEDEQKRFNFSPNRSILDQAGEHRLSAKIYFDHNGDGSPDAYVRTIDPVTISVFDDADTRIEISGETEFSASATGYSKLNATLFGVDEADLIGAADGYIWTLDGETIADATTKEISINLSSLKTSQKYAVSVAYIDPISGDTLTLTNSITVKKSDNSSGDTDSDTDTDDDSGDDDGNDGQTGDGSAYPQLLNDLSVASKTYVQNRTAEPLAVSVDPRIDGTISYKWYVNTVYSTVGGTLLNYEYGLSGNTSSITPSVTPSTATVGKFYYYVEVTNHYGEYTKTTRSNIATIEVIPDNTAPTKYTVNSDGNLTVADYSKVVVDWSTFDEFIDNGGEVLTVTGAYIQNLRVPAVYSTNGYEVHVVDTGYNLDYTWKIKDGSKVSAYLDLALSTTTSLSGVDKGNSALNYDARYSQIIQFKHEGALTTNDKGVLLTMPTTVKDGDGHLNKINTDSTIDYGSYVKGSIEDGLLSVNMKECSDWVVSALKLAALSDYDNSNGTGALTGFVNIPTFVGFELSEFKNVVVGQMIYLDKINMDTIANNKFVGWYYDTAFLEPVSTTDVKSGMLVTREIVTNGLYPRYEKSNSYYPTTSTPVPSTGVIGTTMTQLNLKSLF